jgi:regulator of protease activity HflC (stomatin/prohibitin superfamily)
MKEKDYSGIFVVGILGVLFGLFILFCSMSRIGAGETGVVTLFGNLRPQTLSSGIHFINPLTSVHKMNLRILTTSAKSEAASSDLQTVDTEITLNYSVNPLDVVNIYTKLGVDPEYFESYLINPAMSETFKAVVADFTAEELINKRAAVSRGITALLQKKLNEFGIIVQSVSITNFAFSKTFNTAIEAKVTAQQRVLTEQNNLQRIKVEAEQKIVQAQAEATALNLQKQAITPELLQLRQIENEKIAIDKWNGVMPLYTGSNLPFIMAKN